MPQLHPSPAAAAAAPQAPAAAAAAKRIRTATQAQELAIATEVVDGEIFVEVPTTLVKPAASLTTAPQPKSGQPAIQISLFKGIPYGCKTKYWTAVSNNLNSDSWSSSFPIAAVPTTVEANWDRMLGKRVQQKAALAKKQASKAGDSAACGKGGNAADWVSGGGERDDLEGSHDAPGASDDADSGSATFQEKIDSLLDAYLLQVAAHGGAAAAASSSTAAAAAAPPTSSCAAAKKPSGQPGEDKDEVESASLGLTVKKARKEPLPGPNHVQMAQQQAMHQSSHFASGFSSIAQSFKPDTPEMFEGKAKAIATHIGITSDHACIIVLCEPNVLLTGAPLKDMVDIFTRASGDARVAQTAAFGVATESVIKALGTLYQDIEVRVLCAFLNLEN